MVKKYLKVELADTPFKHQKGLMFRKKLDENEGMLFKFKTPQKLRFWGVNTFIPLSIAFISPENKITKIDYISPHSSKVVTSEEDCDMAIEANYDFFDNNNIRTGQEIEIITDNVLPFISYIRFS